RLWMADPHMNEVARVASSDNDPTAYRHYGWDTGGHGARQFVASLSCERTDGCRQSNAAKTWVRDVRLEVADYAEPSFTTLDGTLLARGWVRGVRGLQAEASDMGSGAAGLSASVNGTQFATGHGDCNAIAGISFSPRVTPCRKNALLIAAPETTHSPFHDGAN